MGVTFSNRIIAITAGVALALGAQALLTQSAAAAGQHRTPSRAWLTGNTAGRGLRWEHGGAAADAIGKIFFTLGRTDYVCSGALVRGRPVDVVLTAAHCVSGGPGRWATSWTFVPGYRDGAEPYGEYTARRFFVSPRWLGPGGASERYDVAFVQVTPVTLIGQAGLARPPAGLPVTFAASQAAAVRPAAYVFGYPALPPFSGQYLNFCAGPAVVSRAVVSRAGGRRAGGRADRRAGSAATGCAMTAGDSGGPWLTGFRPRRGSGTIAAVTAYKLSGSTRTLYGTVLGPVARALYRAATRVWHTIPG